MLLSGSSKSPTCQGQPSIFGVGMHNRPRVVSICAEENDAVVLFSSSDILYLMAHKRTRWRAQLGQMIKA